MIRVRQIKIKVEENNKENLVKKCASKLKIKDNQIKKLKIIKRSIDARKKPVIYYSYIVDLDVYNEDKILTKLKNNQDIIKVENNEYTVAITGTNYLNKRPIIVGAGPCGLIAAYMLSKYGYNPIILERGKKVEERVKDIEEFWNNNTLNINSNVQFGEGGAGTFSDGKLNTLIKDKDNRQRKVFEIFVENGAPKEILYESKPHIGTDLLRNVIINIRKKIINFGGEFRFNSTLTDINHKNNKLTSITVNNNEIIDTDILILAIGHSSRDTFKMLYNKKITMKPKPFAIGVRIQHPQIMINKSQYGQEFHPKLKAANYKLTYKSKSGRGVYTFCMCPGGYVINASSEENMLTINGMSNYNRDSENANSAIIVTVGPDDYGTNPLDGIEFQRTLERKAYELGKGKIPISLFKDYKENTISTSFGNINPVFKGNYKFTNVNEIFPDYINESLKEGIIYFNNKIKGFSSDDAIISAPEARTSSPVRIVRDDFGETNIKGIYPAGEGAGYAGGITSAAIDGLITFEKIVATYKLKI
jgi:hypothetical protein